MQKGEENKKISKHWDNMKPSKEKIRWWQSEQVIRNLNLRIDDIDSPEIFAASYGLLKKTFSDKLPFKECISIGCGNGRKEMKLIKKGIAEKFMLFEISKKRIEEGQKLAEKNGISHKVEFINDDAFKNQIIEKFDLVHWNNSLHHMSDVYLAVKWSFESLKEGGVIYVDDFFGSKRFQWTNEENLWVTKIRKALINTGYLISPLTGREIPKVFKRPNILKLIEADPSEACDSSNILDALKLYFDPKIFIKTGGTVYNSALKDIYGNFESNEKDKLVLNLLMLLDEALTEAGYWHYGIFIAERKKTFLV